MDETRNEFSSCSFSILFWISYLFFVYNIGVGPEAGSVEDCLPLALSNNHV
jgi:hypothetical protein